MQDSLIIECVQTRARLSLAQLVAGDQSRYSDVKYMARLEATDLQCHVEVYDAASTHWPNFFKTLAENWRGWQGKITGESIEGHLVMHATCDQLGHVKFTLDLRPDPLRGGWCVTYPLFAEAGQLESIAARGISFFESAAA